MDDKENSIYKPRLTLEWTTIKSIQSLYGSEIALAKNGVDNFSISIGVPGSYVCFRFKPEEFIDFAEVVCAELNALKKVLEVWNERADN